MKESIGSIRCRLEEGIPSFPGSDDGGGREGCQNEVLVSSILGHGYGFQSSLLLTGFVPGQISFECQSLLLLNGNNGLSFLEFVSMPGMERAWASISNSSMKHLSIPKLLMLLFPLPRSGLPGLC